MKSVYLFFSSLRLSVVLLSFSMLSVFLGTLDQVEIGIRAAQLKYFESFVAFWNYPDSYWLGDIFGWLTIPVPGGWILAPLLLINLVLAFVRHYRLKWENAGGMVTHGGLLLLLIGQLVTTFGQEDSYMRLEEGETGQYIERYYDKELAVTETSPTGEKRVVAISEEVLQDEGLIQHPQLPFTLDVREYLRAARLDNAQGPVAGALAEVNQGVGAQVPIQAQPATREEAARARLGAGVVQVTGEQGPVGTWLVSDHPFFERFPPQQFRYGGNVYELTMRPRREYLGFSLTLEEFIHETYEGTEIPKDFRSIVQLKNPSENESRQVMIYMNNPLRYAGLTFFQSGFEGDDVTIFQVVRNPGWLIPYIASLVITLGLLYQFGVALFKFLVRRSR